MESFELQIDDWGVWKPECRFSTSSRAKEHGKSHFPQNTWRVCNSSNEVVYQHDPYGVLQLEALQELQRFETTEFVRMTFQPQTRNTRNELRRRRTRIESRFDIISRNRQALTGERRLRNQNTQPYLPNFDFYEVKLSSNKVDWKSEGF